MDASPLQKVALITGGTQGIGLGMAQALARDGFDLILGFLANKTAAEGTKEGLLAEYPSRKVVLVQGDVTLEATLEALFDPVDNVFDGQLTALIHCAGSVQRMGVATLDGGVRTLDSYDYYQEMYPKFFIRAAERALSYLPDCCGRILVITNPGCNMLSYPRVSLYDMPGCGKASMEYLARSYAKKLAPRGITCNIIVPGYFKTRQWDVFVGGSEQIEKNVVSKIPMRRWGHVSEIGSTAAFLCSSAAAYITGAVIPVDGGLLLS